TNKTDETKNTIQILTSIFENSTTDLQYTYCEDIDDGRGLTFGFAGFCSGTYDGTMFLKEYKKLNPNNILTKYIPIFEKIDDMDNHENTDGLENFGDDFASCINDSKFIEAQKNLCDRLYWNPSQDALTEIGAKYSITKGELYDSFINHGEDGAKEIIDEATSNVGGTPGEGIDEKEWLSSFLEERLKVLSEDSTWKEAVDRVHVYQKLLDENNFELTRPMTVDCYGDTFTITKYKDDVEVPEISSENETISNENHDNEAEIPKSKNDKKDTTVVNDYESSTTKNEYTDFDDFTNNKESEKTILQENNKDSTSTLIKTANDSVDINSYDNELPKTGESRNLTYLLIGVFIILIGILAMIIINKKKKHLFFHL
ncbi:MAG: chitosanase, partial [Clostridiales bacterium]